MSRRPGLADRYERVTRPEALEVLRRVFHSMNRGMVVLWRLGLGRFAGMWPGGFGRLLVLEHTGRRSGTAYLAPVNYTIAGADLYCVAAFGLRTDWYRNLMARPQAAVWLPDGRRRVHVSDVSDHPDRLDLMRRVLADSGFAARLFGLDATRISDEDLAAATADYRLVRLQPLEREPAPDGPGSLWWMWLVAAALLLARRRVRANG